MTDTIKAEPLPETMLDELGNLLDGMTDTQRERVAAAVAAIRAGQKADAERLQTNILQGVEKIVQEREKKTRSFWRAVFDAIWSGIAHAHALLQKVIKE